MHPQAFPRHFDRTSFLQRAEQQTWRIVVRPASSIACNIDLPYIFRGRNQVNRLDESDVNNAIQADCDLRHKLGSFLDQDDNGRFLPQDFPSVLVICLPPPAQFNCRNCVADQNAGLSQNQFRRLPIGFHVGLGCLAAIMIWMR